MTDCLPRCEIWTRWIREYFVSASSAPSCELVKAEGVDTVGTPKTDSPDCAGHNRNSAYHRCFGRAFGDAFHDDGYQCRLLHLFTFTRFCWVYTDDRQFTSKFSVQTRGCLSRTHSELY